MEMPKNFRTAFNGFNREDVVRYIEFTNSRHATQLGELNTELEFLRGKLAAAQAVPAQDPAMAEELNQARQTIADLNERCARLEQALQESAAKADTSDLDARCMELERQRDKALEQARQAQEAQTAAAQSCAAQELEAYRRAERTERMARERAEQVYTTVNGVLADATVKVDEAASQLGEVSTQVLARLNQLQDAVTGSKQALQEAASAMYAIRPTGE